MLCDDSGPANGPEPCSLDHTETVAVAMICRLVSGDACEAELAAAREWRDMNPEQARAFARISHAWTLIKPAGAAWTRRQRAWRLVSALAKARAFLLGCRPGRLVARLRGTQGQDAPELAIRHGGLR